MRLRQQKQAQRYTHSPETRDGDAATRGHGDGNRLVLPRVAASVFVAVSPLFNRVAPSSPLGHAHILSPQQLLQACQQRHGWRHVEALGSPQQDAFAIGKLQRQHHLASTWRLG